MTYFKDISKPDSLLTIFIGLLVTEVIMITLFRSDRGIWKTMINRWYTEFTWSAIISDVAIVMIGFFITQYLYKQFVGQKWNPLIFIGILLAVQIIHDILYYLFVIRPYPPQTNKIMDFMNLYAEEVSWGAITGDSLMVIMTAVIAMLLKNTSNYNQLFVMTSSLYLMPYLLYQKY
tara:strand:- start:34 stop:561 length:528 start_codon:yes stop_codon:yes gene_type:complete